LFPLIGSFSITGECQTSRRAVSSKACRLKLSQEMIAFAHRIMRGKKEKPSEPTPTIQVGIDHRVPSYIKAEVDKNPEVEEGGKYIGYVLPALDPRLEALGFDRRMQAIVILDFLPSGPNATRTSVELQPDGEYQERLFRQIEQIDPDIEHVGTW